ncbi:MAG: membrane protein insertase YidC [Bacteroidales bacterium]|nr:membrane protein insertase YidC [Bacteroidales bacterium]
MDKNTITGLILIFAIFIGFSVYNNSRLNKEYEKTVAVAESHYANGELETAKTEFINALRFKPNKPEIIAKINEINLKLGVSQETPKVDTATSPKIQTEIPVIPAIADSIANVGQYGVFSNASKGENDFITLENNKVELKISLKGGKVYSARLKDYKTFDSHPLILFSGDSTVFGFKFFTADNRAVKTNDLYFKPVSDKKSFLVDSKPESVSLRLLADNKGYIEFKYTLAPDKYMVDFEVSFNSMENIIASNQSSLALDWKMYIPQQEKGRINEESYSTINYKYFQGDVDGLKLRSSKDEKSDITTKLSWVSFQDQFFSSILVTNDFFLSGSVSSTHTPTSEKYIRYYETEVGVPFSTTSAKPISLKLYFGPNHILTLKKEGLQLEKVVFLGRNIISWINRFIIIPIFNWLEKYIASYGLIILILTIIIKIVLFPLTFKSYKSQAKMQVLKPLIDELGKKFTKKEDAMKKQQATMDLYKRAGINPMGGCLPMLLQMPILFAMFRFFPVSIELRQESFLWATDLSTYDSILTLPFNIPMYGDHVSLFTILMTLATILTMKMSGSTGTDQPGMKLMMYMMPVMFMFMLNNFSSGLTYYYFLANILSYGQNVVMKRFINADAVLATLEENKKKPVKKSKWQQRLEAAAKQQGMNMPKKR